jgi:hypothetical protein
MRFLLSLAALLSMTAATAKAATINVGSNISGWNISYTEHPFGNNPTAPGAVLSNAAYNKMTQIAPAGGVIRYMDALQTNASPQTSPANRSFNNLDIKGITWESISAVSNQTRTRPWVNIPQGSAAFFDNASADVSQSYAYQMGRTIAQGMDARLGFIKVEFSNELWNGGDQNQGTQNMFRARQHPLTTSGASDFQRLSEMAYIDWYRSVKAFEKGVQSTGKNIEVRGVAPGFIANNYYSVYGLNNLKSRMASDPDLSRILAKSRIAIAPYAPGSPTDIGNIQPNDTPQAIMNRTKQFVEQNYPNWFASNKNTAIANGLQGLDLYETMALSTYDFTSGTNILVDMARSNDPAIRNFHKWFFEYVADITNDPNASLMIFGSAGIPWTEQYGQWSPWESYNSVDGAKALGIKDFIASRANNVDPFGPNVPEPTAIGLLATAAGVFCFRRQRVA